MHTRIQVVVISLFATVATTAVQDVDEILPGARGVDIPGWSVLVQQDPFTDACLFAAAVPDDEGLMVSYEVGSSSGLNVVMGGFPALNVDPVEVEYRIDRPPAQTGTWHATTGSGGSAITVPDSLVTDVLRAERVAVRAQDHTRVLQWANGDAVYEIMSACVGASEPEQPQQTEPTVLPDDGSSVARVWVSAHSQNCVDCTTKVPPSHPMAQRVTMAASWLEADTPVGESMPIWLRTGAALADVLPQMPADPPQRVESGDREVYTWMFEDRSRIVLTFGPSGTGEGLALRAVYVRG